MSCQSDPPKDGVIYLTVLVLVITLYLVIEKTRTELTDLSSRVEQLEKVK